MRSLKNVIFAIGYVTQLNRNWRAYNRASFFSMVLNYMCNWNFSEVVVLAPKVI